MDLAKCARNLNRILHPISACDAVKCDDSDLSTLKRKIRKVSEIALNSNLNQNHLVSGLLQYQTITAHSPQLCVITAVMIRLVQSTCGVRKRCWRSTIL